MKKVMAIVLVAACFFFSPNSGIAAPLSKTFKYHMHQIFDSYNNARISFSLNKFDITDIYLQHLQESIDSAKKHMPDKNRDGSKLDKILFMENIDKLKQSVSSLKQINEAKFRDPILTETLSKRIFSMCVTCHTEVKKSSLFSFPKRTSLFGEYMHKVSDNLDLALIKSEEENMPDEVEEHVQLMAYYIDLLLPIFPKEGPSGIILDKAAFQKRAKDIKIQLKKESKKVKMEDLEKSREKLNTLCVACHEPERIK